MNLSWGSGKLYLFICSRFSMPRILLCTTSHASTSTDHNDGGFVADLAPSNSLGDMQTDVTAQSLINISVVNVGGFPVWTVKESKDCGPKEVSIPMIFTKTQGLVSNAFQQSTVICSSTFLLHVVFRVLISPSA